MQRLSDRLMIYTLKFIPASGNCICHKTQKTFDQTMSSHLCLDDFVLSKGKHLGIVWTTILMRNLCFSTIPSEIETAQFEGFSAFSKEYFSDSFRLLIAAWYYGGFAFIPVCSLRMSFNADSGTKFNPNFHYLSISPLAQGEISLCVCFTTHVW